MYDNIYSFKCGIEYHAPTDCDVIKKWLTKCADDSETANYISANTKDVSPFFSIFTLLDDYINLCSDMPPFTSVQSSDKILFCSRNPLNFIAFETNREIEQLKE